MLVGQNSQIHRGGKTKIQVNETFVLFEKAISRRETQGTE